MTRTPRAARRPRGPLARTSAIAAVLLGTVVVTACSAPTAPSETAPPEAVPPAADGVVAESVIHAGTRMGVVELVVGDLDTMRAFYEDAIGLDVVEDPDGTGGDDPTGRAVALGAGGEPLIRLLEGEGEGARPEDAGLYHSAILYSDGPALAEVLVRLAELVPELYQGSADHRVSHAFYFGDPEGNGVELYVDTPPDTWEWNDGTIAMGSFALDPNAFIAEHLGADSAGGATMGHVHLKVGDIAQAREFYADVLGFAVTSESDSSLFLSAGGYHHHLGANTWTSAGAGERPATLGLGSIEVLVPTASDLNAVAARLDAAGIAHERGDGLLRTADPWGSVVVLRAER